MVSFARGNFQIIILIRDTSLTVNDIDKESEVSLLNIVHNIILKL